MYQGHKTSRLRSEMCLLKTLIIPLRANPQSCPQFNIAIENGIFIVDLPINNGDFPVCYVSLPEGKLC